MVVQLLKICPNCKEPIPPDPYRTRASYWNPKGEEEHEECFKKRMKLDQPKAIAQLPRGGLF